MINLQVNAGEVLQQTAFEKLPGWKTADKRTSFSAFLRSCTQMKIDNRAFSKNPLFGGEYADWKPVCDQAQTLGPEPDNSKIRTFFETSFIPFTVIDPDREQGLFTGYFEPQIKGSLTKGAGYEVPVYAKPDDLISFNKDQQQQSGFAYGRLDDGKPVAYFTRKEIEQGILDDRKLEILWLTSLADRFFMQVQGSGQILLPDGKTIRLAYAGKTGQPYTAIGGILIKRKQAEKQTMSMQIIRNWLEDNPDKAQALMWENKSFVFFRILQDKNNTSGPVGAQLVSLTPRVSFAVDRRYWAFGTPIWLDTNMQLDQKSQDKSWQSLMIAQDTGSAIRGYARGDVFWGSGDDAGQIAGRMKASGKMVVFLPNDLAGKIGN